MKHSIEIEKLDEIYDSGSLQVYLGFVFGVKMIIVKSKLIVGYISREDWDKHGYKFKGKKINKIEEGYYCYFREENDRLYLV